MFGPRLKALREQLATAKTEFERIDRALTADPETLSDDDRTKLEADADAQLDRGEKIAEEIASLEQREQRFTAVADVTRRVTADIDRAGRDRDAEPTLDAGEYFAEVFRTFGRDNGDGNVDRFMDRCGRYFDRANQATTDNAGVLPTPIVGELIKFVDASRPCFASLTSRPMPAAGKTFTRPRVTQRVTVGEQLVEFDPLASQKMTIVGDQVTKRTFGGTLDISEQDIDWTDPAMLAIVINDFADEYAVQTEEAASDFLGDLPATFSPYVVTDVGTIVDSFVDAAVAVYNQCKKFPDKVWLDLTDWALLASTLTANNERPALKVIKEAFEEAKLPPLDFIVVPGLDIPAAEDLTPAGNRVMGVSRYVESYEQQKGMLRLNSPGTLSQTIATYGYVAFHGRSEGFVYLGADATP